MSKQNVLDTFEIKVYRETSMIDKTFQRHM